MAPISPDLESSGGRFTDRQSPSSGTRKSRHWETATGSRTLGAGESPGGCGIWAEESCRIGILSGT